MFLVRSECSVDEGLSNWIYICIYIYYVYIHILYIHIYSYTIFIFLDIHLFIYISISRFLTCLWTSSCLWIDINWFSVFLFVVLLFCIYGGISSPRWHAGRVSPRQVAGGSGLHQLWRRNWPRSRRCRELLSLQPQGASAAEHASVAQRSAQYGTWKNNVFEIWRK